MQPLRQYDSSIVISFDKGVTFNLDSYASEGLNMMLHFHEMENLKAFFDTVIDADKNIFGKKEGVK
jgi:hypothetical protein